MRRLAGPLFGVLLALAGGLGASAGPAIVSERPEQVALTIYPDQYADGGDISDADLEFDGETGLALVTEWRTIDAPAGEIVLTFRGVAEGMVPQTATIQGLPAALVEQNQDFDLLSPGSMIIRSVGASAKRIRTDRATGRETVDDVVIRSSAGGVVLEVDGRLEVMGCGGDRERLVFDRIPDGLNAEPTLSVRLRVREAGRYRVKLSYLAVGLLWQANYVGAVQADGSIDLTGWITLRNLSRTSFTDAPTQFVAGELEMTGETVIDTVSAEPRPRGCWPMDVTSGRPRVRLQPRPPVSAAMDGDEGAVEAIVVTGSRIQANYQDAPLAIAAMAQESDLGDYKLYTLPQPTTVAARQTKQVLMLSKPGVRLDRVYRFAVDLDDIDPDYVDEEDLEVFAASLFLTGKNLKSNNLGTALPGGRLLLTETGADGRTVLVSRTGLWASPVGAPVEVRAVSETWDVEVRPRVVSKTVKRDRARYEVEVAIANQKNRPVEFELIQWMDEDERPRIFSGARRFKARPYGLTWPMTLEAGEVRTVRYAVEVDE